MDDIVSVLVLIGMLVLNPIVAWIGFRQGERRSFIEEMVKRGYDEREAIAAWRKYSERKQSE